MKLGGKPFFCFRVLGFLWTQVLGWCPLSPEPFLPDLPSSPLLQYRTHWFSSTELVRVMLWMPPFTCRPRLGEG